MDDHTHILCPVSGASASERALPIAADVAHRFGGTLTLFCAVEDEHEVASHTAYLQRHAALLRLRQTTVEIDEEVVVDAHAPQAICSRCGDNTLVVMATSTQPFLHDGYIGSAAEAVVRDSGRPALIVGPKVEPDDRHWDPQRVIIGYDGSSVAEEAVPIAQRWARELDVPLWIISVVTESDLTEEQETGPARRLAESVGAEWEVLHHHKPALGLAAAGGTDSLIVVTSHGRTGLKRIAMGSVTTETVRRSIAPVLVVPSSLSDD